MWRPVSSEDVHTHSVRQYDLTGNMSFIYPSCVEAAQAVNSTPEEVASCCIRNRKRVRGSVFRFVDDDEFEKGAKFERAYSKRGYSIRKYTLDNRFIAEFRVFELWGLLGRVDTDVIDCCLLRQKSAHGFIWRCSGWDEHVPDEHQKEPNFEPVSLPARKAEKKPVRQYTLDGNFIREYESLTEAARKVLGISTVTNISACCKRRIENFRGYIWRYVSDDEFFEGS